MCDEKYENLEKISFLQMKHLFFQIEHANQAHF